MNDTPITPVAYLKRRRQAAGLDVADVAARIATTPPIAERLRSEWIELIEADAAPANFSTIVAMRQVFSFDLDVLFALEAIRLGVAVALPRLCSICACSDFDGCHTTFGPCSWAREDLCSACHRMRGQTFTAADRPEQPAQPGHPA